MHSKDAADEVVQQTCEYALTKAHVYDERRSGVFTWLTIILKARVSDYYREQSKTIPLSSFLTSLEEGDVEEGFRDLDFEQHKLLEYADTSYNQYTRVMLEEALSLLGGVHEHIVRMCFIGGMTYAEITEETGISRRKVKRIVTTSLKRLRRILHISSSNNIQLSEMEESDGTEEAKTVLGSES